MVLVGEEDVSARLSAWIRRELDLTELADKIDTLLDKHAFVQDIMVEILVYGGYYSSEEVRQFMAECQKLRTLKSYEVEKLRADGYLRYKHYIKAGAIYDEVICYLEKEKQENESSEMYIIIKQLLWPEIFSLMKQRAVLLRHIR